MRLRIFTEPQQGATYDQLLAVAQLTEELGFDAFFRSDHYMRIGRGRPRPRVDRRVGDARRARSRDVAHPARHARHAGDVPASRRARDRRRPGRRDERRPHRARSRWRLVRGGARGVRDPVPHHRRAVRDARGPARDPHRDVGDAGGRDASTTRAGTTRSSTPLRCRSRCNARARRSSSAATAPSARRGSRRSTPTSSTCRSHRSTTTGPRATSSAPRARRPDAIPRRCATPSRSSCVSAATKRSTSDARRRVGRTPDDLRANAAGGLVDEVVERLRAFGDAGAETVYLQVLDLDDLDHVRLDRGRGRAPPLGGTSVDVRFGVHAGLQNTSIAELQGLWRRIEELGFDWISIWDHFYAADNTGNPHCLEAITTHAALASTTERVQCGSLVYSAGYRHPAVLANAIATLDQIAEGRVVLGLGGGWLQQEYDVYGMHYGTPGRTAADARRVHPMRARAAHAGRAPTSTASSSPCATRSANRSRCRNGCRSGSAAAARR